MSRASNNSNSNRPIPDWVANLTQTSSWRLFCRALKVRVADKTRPCLALSPIDDSDAATILRAQGAIEALQWVIDGGWELLTIEDER